MAISPLAAHAGSEPNGTAAASLSSGPALEKPSRKAAGLPQVQIDRIEILGVSALAGPDVEAALEINVGDLLSHETVVRTSENIQALYRVKGYAQVRLKTELERIRGEDGSPENLIKVTISEGFPTRIASLVVLSEGADGEHPDARITSLASRIELRPGDVYDQDKISAVRRAVQDALAADEFVGARVTEVQAKATTPSQAFEQEKGAAAGWVNLVMKVNLGDRVSFGFRGNMAFTRGKLSSLVEEQRLLGLGRDYVASVQARLVEAYKAAGYAQVRIDAVTQERPELQERHVSFEVTEGPRVRIESIDFDGNVVFPKAALRREFLNRAPGLTQKGFYSEVEIQKSAELLIEWIKSQGYLGAKLITINRTFDARAPKVSLLVYLYEGDQTVVDSVSLEGLQAISRSEALSILGVKENEPLNLFSFNEGVEALKARLRSLGHLDARIENEATESVVQYFQDNREARIKLQVQEGPRYRVSRIDIEGLTDTHEEVLTRELVFKEGDTLEEGKLLESEARLRRLQIFSIVTLRAVDDPERIGFKVVKISAQEGTPGVIAGGVGYRNDLGIRTFGQTGYTNLWHKNHTLSLIANANRRFDEGFCDNSRGNANSAAVIDSGHSCFIEYQLQLAYIWPWFSGIPELTFRPQLTVDRTQYVILDSSSISLAATWERPILKRPNWVGAFTYSLERINQFNARDEEQNGTIRIGSITPALKLDMRDNPLAPTRGLFASVSFELASPVFFSQSSPYPVGYSKFQLRSDYHLPLFGGDVIFYSSFRTGLERNLEAPPESDPGSRAYRIPLSKQFTLGGIGSLRGFKEQSINYDLVAIRGTLSYVNYRFQLDLPFAGPMRFGPFLDAANLLVDRYSFGNLRAGAGVGFHYQSPVGPVNFDWGFNLAPQPGEDPFRFYFSIGVI